MPKLGEIDGTAIITGGMTPVFTTLLAIAGVGDTFNPIPVFNGLEADVGTVPREAFRAGSIGRDLKVCG